MEESQGIMSGKHQLEFKVELKVENTDETYSSREFHAHLCDDG